MFNYYILKSKVTILNMRKSVGNIFVSFMLKFETSETIRDKINTTHNRYIKNISVHNNKHFKPRNNEEFSEYLAGIIDGNGYITKSELVIQLWKNDKSLGHYLKKTLGYGYITFDDDNLLLKINNHIGIEKVINLTYGKLKSEEIIKSINDYSYLPYCDYTSYINTYKSFLYDKSAFKDSWWFAGFTDCGGRLNLSNFYIENKVETNRFEARCYFFIYHKESRILYYIQQCLGGGHVNIITKPEHELFNMTIYKSSDFATSRQIISYFDSKFLLSQRHINFFKWRKAYIIIGNTSLTIKKLHNSSLNINNNINKFNNIFSLQNNNRKYSTSSHLKENKLLKKRINIFNILFFNKYTHPKNILKLSFYLILTGCILHLFGDIINNIFFYIPYASFYIFDLPYINDWVIKKSIYLILKFKNKDFLKDLFCKWLILYVIRFILIGSCIWLDALFPSNVYINFIINILNVTLFRILFPWFFKASVIEVLSNINFRLNSYPYLTTILNKFLLDYTRLTYEIELSVLEIKSKVINNINIKLNLEKFLYSKIEKPLEKISSKSRFNRILDWKNSLLINLAKTLKFSLVDKVKYQKNIFIIKLDFRQISPNPHLRFIQFCRTHNIYPVTRSSYNFLMLLFKHNLNPNLVFTFFSSDTFDVNKSEYYSLITKKSDLLLPAMQPIKGDIVSMRGGASSNRDLQDLGYNDSQDEKNQQDFMDIANNDSEYEISNGDYSDSDTELKIPIEDINLNNLSSGQIIKLFSRFLRFDILNVDLANQGFLAKDGINPTKALEYLYLPTRRLKSDNSKSYLNNDAFKSLLNKYEDKKREGELFYMFKDYIKKSLFKLNNKGDPTLNSPVIKSDVSLNKFLKDMLYYLKKVGGNPLNESTYDHIKTHYLQFVKSDLDRDVVFYTFKPDYLNNLSTISKDIIKYFWGVHKSETIEELNFNLAICINNSFFKASETGPSEVMSYMLNYYFNGQEIVITPEAKQENRKRPDYVVYEIFQNGLSKAFLTMEIKEKLIKIEDALDQVITAAHYLKHQDNNLN